MTPRLALVALFAAVFAACSPADQAPTVAPGPRALVTSDGGIRLVLRADVEKEMTRGDVDLLNVEAPVVVRRAIHAEGLTSDELRWAGRKVLLHSERGVVCEGVVGAVEALGRFHPDESARAEWHDDDGNLRVGLDEMKQRAWELAPDLGHLSLTGRVTVTRGDCDGAVWAQLADEAAPAAAAAEPASPALAALALAALRATDTYREQQAEYEKFKEDAPEDRDPRGLPASWEDYNGSTSFSVIAHPSGETFVITSLQAGEGCGDFQGSMLDLWRLHGDTLEPVPADALSLDDLPTGAADVDGDGHLDLLTPHGYLRQTEQGFDDEQSSAIPANEGCGC